MKYMGINEIRKAYLEFFASQGHLVLPSFSLVPENDKSLLLIGAGMAPLKPYFTGQQVPPRTRVSTCQKCIRTGDIDNVGKTARHGTFFEMLGNFSFGDYFKKEAIHWAWKFLTEVAELPKDRLWVTVYLDDDEAVKIWHEQEGVPLEHIVRLGKEDNFWEIGQGPCGPCSEIHFDRGEDKGCGKPTCGPGCDCDRFMEVWNLVFTQFNKEEDGTYSNLPKPNIDTGMGLERLGVVLQEVNSIFEVDTLRNIIKSISALAGVEYGAALKSDISIRVITDHLRAATFMISDGIMPSNEGRGYVLRRLLRRAARHGRLLGIKGAFLEEISKTVIAQSSGAYPELADKQEFILNVISLEEQRFAQTVDKGLELLRQQIEALKAEDGKVLSGEAAFTLYDTYGFPVDLTEEIMEDEGLSVDREGFDACMKQQKEFTRSRRAQNDYMGAGEDSELWSLIRELPETEFTGYERTEDESKVIFIAKDNEQVSELHLSENTAEGKIPAVVVLDHTPFYREKGGQVGDKGVLKCENGTFVVEDTKDIFGKAVHYGYLSEGTLVSGKTVKACVCERNRMATCRNHSVTHLLHAALRKVLGTHVEQAGSYVNADRTRFDFSHYAALTADELAEVERLVNESIMQALPVTTEVKSLDEARKSGAMALFGEKYGTEVRVVSMGDVSKELCGGTHVKNTGNIGLFRIVSETGVAAGVRRIEGVTGFNFLAMAHREEDSVRSLAAALKTTPANALQRIEAIQAEVKELERELEKERRAAVSGKLDDIVNGAVDVKGVKLAVASLPGQDMDALRSLGDTVKDKLGSGVVVLFSENEGKVSLIITATKDMGKRVHCGKLISVLAKEIGGGGGGRPDMAQAGGKNPGGINAALAKAPELLADMLG